MKTSSAKAKGRRLQQHVASVLLKAFPELTERDIRSTPMGVQGNDLTLSEEAHRLLKIDFECKAVESLNIWDAMKQVEERCGDDTPVVVFKRSRSKVYAAVELEYLVELLKQANGGSDEHRQ